MTRTATSLHVLKRQQQPEQMPRMTVIADHLHAWMTVSLRQQRQLRHCFEKVGYNRIQVMMTPARPQAARLGVDLT